MTPDAVLEGVTVLARETAGAEAPGVVVLDVGGATTDVYCVPDPDAEQASLGREAVGVPARRRTVEGDLGRLVERRRAARGGRGRGPARARATTRSPWARRPRRSPCAGTCGPRPPTAPGGASARAAGLVVLSGGVFRHADPAAVDAVVARLAADAGGAGSVVSDTAGRRRPALRPRRRRAARRRAPAAAAGLARGLLAGAVTSPVG